MEIGAVLDAPDAVVDEVVDHPEVVDGATDQPEPAAESAADSTPEGDGRVIPQWIRNMKESDPVGYKEAKAIFFGKRAFEEKIPGGVKELDEILTTLNEHGGREGLATMIGELTGKAAELDGIAEKMANGDPSLISDFLANSPEGFAKIAPIVAREWANADPEGYAHEITGIFAATLARPNEAGESVASVVKDLEYALRYNDQDGMKAAAAKLSGWTNGMIADARKAPPAPRQTKDGGKIDEREQSVNQREAAIAAAEFDGKIESFKAPLIETELKSFFARAPGDAEKKEAAIRMLRDDVNAALKKEVQEKGKNSTAQMVIALRNQGKMEEAVKIAKSRETILIQQLAPKVGRIIYGSLAAPKPAVEKKPDVAARAPIPANVKAKDKFDAIWGA